MEKDEKWKTECSAGDIDRFLEYFEIKWEDIPPEVRLISFSFSKYFKEVSGLNQLIKLIENRTDGSKKLKGKIRITIDYDAGFPVAVIRVSER